MEKKEARPSFGFEAGFQYVKRETVDVWHVAGANALGKREWRKLCCIGLNDRSARDVGLHECAGHRRSGGQNDATSARARYGLSGIGCAETCARLQGHVGISLSASILMSFGLGGRTDLRAPAADRPIRALGSGPA